MITKIKEEILRLTIDLSLCNNGAYDEQLQQAKTKKDGSKKKNDNTVI